MDTLGVSAGSRASSDGRRAPATQGHALRPSSATPGDGQRTGASPRLAMPVPVPHAARGAGWPACAAGTRRHVSGGVPARATLPPTPCRCRCHACLRPLPKVMVAPATPRRAGGRLQPRTGARQY
ncbi:hypothetical protein GQ55_4G280800 [Panicum hallii var. hallii]|uniref:Uncharacterized protein n=1 Tax=Panicum hallii var. hallii TaxID=1504633 RepID=A0A2T7E108_9POAL|nr:hypothetical protein GQ55_4G280800 [Panicum hallii var. hallii]